MLIHDKRGKFRGKLSEEKISIAEWGSRSSLKMSFGSRDIMPLAGFSRREGIFRKYFSNLENCVQRARKPASPAVREHEDPQDGEQSPRDLISAANMREPHIVTGNQINDASHQDNSRHRLAMVLPRSSNRRTVA